MCIQSIGILSTMEVIYVFMENKYCLFFELGVFVSCSSHSAVAKFQLVCFVSLISDRASKIFVQIDISSKVLFIFPCKWKTDGFLFVTFRFYRKFKTSRNFKK